MQSRSLFRETGMDHARSLGPILVKFVIVVCSFGLSSLAIGAEIESRSNGVKVHKKATSKSPVLKKLKKGDILESFERSGMFWQVKLQDGAPGFVSVLKVKRKASQGKAGLINSIRQVQKSGRNTDDVANNRSRSAVMGVRGLAEDGNTEFAGNVKPNLRAVYFMEDNFSTPSQVEKLGDLVFSEIEKKAAR